MIPEADKTSKVQEAQKLTRFTRLLPQRVLKLKTVAHGPCVMNCQPLGPEGPGMWCYWVITQAEVGFLDDVSVFGSPMLLSREST